MSKLGYTWYPKDWGNSDAVFELTLIERGLYRELIDMAMLNDNKTIINVKTWARKFGSNEDEIEQILITLNDLNLIEIDNINLFIPSCEPRLNLIRGGRKGGKKSTKNKPTIKPIDKPNVKPTINQIENKIKEKEIYNTITPEKFLEWFNNGRLKNGFKQSKFNRLSYSDKQNLDELIKVHNGDDFLHAFNVFIKNEWVLNNNQATPTHFLKIDNFEKYLNTEKKQLTLGEKLMGKQ